MLTQPARRRGRPRKPATRPQASKPAKPVADPYGEQTSAGRVLLALRAGPVERAGLRERLGGTLDYAVNSLRRQGLIVVHNEYVHITAAGLQHCPSRRPTTLKRCVNTSGGRRNPGGTGIPTGATSCTQSRPFAKQTRSPAASA